MKFLINKKNEIKLLQKIWRHKLHQNVVYLRINLQLLAICHLLWWWMAVSWRNLKLFSRLQQADNAFKRNVRRCLLSIENQFATCASFHVTHRFMVAKSRRGKQAFVRLDTIGSQWQANRLISIWQCRTMANWFPS